MGCCSISPKYIFELLDPFLFVLVESPPAARNSWKSLSVNCVPLSVTTACGIPNLDSTSRLKKRRILKDVISEKGSASTHLVK
ncbi:hypothetical protein L195_g043841 [Trifolium pratense]|uniref:Uncharacterized protein n=1 Tax=Trifolium pratense TaxID=57577 RepID=A0A2K3MAD4_TRIPR|nr:hypothetical protein L195_g043841 [Trifolium pratense]